MLIHKHDRMFFHKETVFSPETKNLNNAFVKYMYVVD